MKLKMLLAIILTILSVANLQAATVTIIGDEAARFMQNDLLWTGGVSGEIVNTTSGQVIRLNGRYNGEAASCDFATKLDPSGNIILATQAPFKCTFEDGNL